MEEQIQQQKNPHLEPNNKVILILFHSSWIIMGILILINIIYLLGDFNFIIIPIYLIFLFWLLALVTGVLSLINKKYSGKLLLATFINLINSFLVFIFSLFIFDPSCCI